MSKQAAYYKHEKSIASVGYRDRLYTIVPDRQQDVQRLDIFFGPNGSLRASRISQIRTPNTPTSFSCHRSLHLRLLGELLRQHGQLRSVLVHADVRAAHASLAVERRAAVQHSVVIDDCVKSFSWQYVRKTLGKSDEPTAVPGDSCTQYSESALVRNLFHTLIASYLSRSK